MLCDQRDLAECLSSLAESVRTQANLRLPQGSSLLSSYPNPLTLPYSIPHNLLPDTELMCFLEPLTVLVPSSATLDSVMESGLSLSTQLQQGSHLQCLLTNQPVFHVRTTLSTSHPAYSIESSPASAYLTLFQVHQALLGSQRPSTQRPHNSVAHSPAFKSFLQGLTSVPDISDPLRTKLEVVHQHYTHLSIGTLPPASCLLPLEFQKLLAHVNPRASVWAAVLPPYIHLLGTSCPSEFSAFGTSASRMRDLHSHPSVLFHDSGYSMLPLPFSKAQVESSISHLHNMLLDTLSANQSYSPSTPPPQTLILSERPSWSLPSGSTQSTSSQLHECPKRALVTPTLRVSKTLWKYSVHKFAVARMSQKSLSHSHPQSFQENPRQ
jgi:hypothetical protein